MLRRAGFELAHELATNRAEFEAALAGPPVDLVLSGYALRDWTGMAALALLRERGLAVPFILVTGTLDTDAAVGCIRQGASDYVLREHLGRLPQAVTQALHERQLREESRQARRLLAESERRFRALTLASADLLWVADRAGRVSGRLARWQSFTGQSETELAGYGWLEAIHPEDRNTLCEALDRAVAGAAAFDTEFRLRRPEGSYRRFAFKGVPVKASDGTLLEWIGSANDITERSELQQQLFHAQRLEAVGQLAGGIAHDFNNILTSVLGFSQFLLEQLPEESPHRADALEIYRAGELAALLTRKLLAFSRRQAVHPEVLDLSRAVEEGAPLLGRLLGQDIRLELETRARPALVSADPGQLEQVVLNLAVNARDAMPQGGRLLIRTSEVSLASGLLHAHGVVPPGRYVLLSVADRGVGMTADVVDHIFEPFFTTKGMRGSGLGLSTVYGIVRQSGGYVVVQSTPGAGTRFDLYLPAAAAAPATPSVARPHGAAWGDEALLVVEDQPAIRALVQRVLSSAGYAVLLAENGDEARLLARRATRLHLIIMDILLSGERGPELAGELRELHPSARILFISGNTGLADEAHLPEGSHWFLQKPFGPEQLLTTVRAALDAPTASTIAPDWSAP
ncbi:MAG TPA: response regulator [Gemmatimonadales bacterium]|nr:response regulator [Gemmatimonadales bacterium]